MHINVILAKCYPSEQKSSILTWCIIWYSIAALPVWWKCVKLDYFPFELFDRQIQSLEKKNYLPMMSARGLPPRLQFIIITLRCIRLPLELPSLRLIRFFETGLMHQVDPLKPTSKYRASIKSTIIFRNFHRMKGKNKEIVQYRVENETKLSWTTVLFPSRGTYSTLSFPWFDFFDSHYGRKWLSRY